VMQARGGPNQRFEVGCNIQVEGMREEFRFLAGERRDSEADSPYAAPVRCEQIGSK